MTAAYIKIIDNSLYPKRAVAEARQAYREYCDVEVAPAVDGGVELAFSVKPPYANKEREVILNFLNYALDLSMQMHIEDTA